MARSISVTRPRVAGGHRYASIPEAAAYLSCDHKLVRRMIAGGHLTGYRMPGSPAIRVDLDELDAAILAATRQAG